MRLRSAPALLLISVLGPVLGGLLFVPVFHWIQDTFSPQGSLEGRDLSMYAYRDQALLLLFGAGLVGLVIVCAWKARSAPTRFAILILGLCVSGATLLRVFFSLMAP